MARSSFSWEPRTPNQHLLRQAILDHDITFVTGPAGTGKTFCSIMTALELKDKTVKNGGVERIVATRPLVTAGKAVGYLPGDLMEKCQPFMRAIHDTIVASNHPQTQAILEGHGLEIAPLEFLRGITFDDSIVILDEAQNVDPHQMEMFLTRLGQNARMVICGDPHQCDLKVMNGLSHAVQLLKYNPKFAIVEFTLDDIQRAGIVREVLIAYALDREQRAKRGK